MADEIVSLHVRRTAAHLLEHLRVQTGRVDIGELDIEIRASMPQRRRAIYWLRKLGARITTTNDGYQLENRDFQIPVGNDAPEVTVIRVEIERVVEKPTLSPEESTAQALQRATPGQLIAELQRQGYTPSEGFTFHKVIEVTRPGKRTRVA